MCVIVDTNVISQVLFDTSDPRFEPLRDGLYGARRPLQLVFGGRLNEEYQRNGRVRRMILNLARAGRAKRLPDEEVDAETRSLAEACVCQSDDPHVIALARLSRARILVSLDEDLRSDFKDHRLVNNPRGKVYTKAAHRGLLKRCELGTR
jgi:hypothetical protein